MSIRKGLVWKSRSRPYPMANPTRTENAKVRPSVLLLTARSTPRRPASEFAADESRALLPERGIKGIMLLSWLVVTSRRLNYSPKRPGIKRVQLL